MLTQTVKLFGISQKENLKKSQNWTKSKGNGLILTELCRLLYRYTQKDIHSTSKKTLGAVETSPKTSNESVLEMNE